MGVQIVRVPPAFQHPTDEDGYHLPGAHLEPLYYIDDALKICLQIYENVSEGTPDSPIFDSVNQMKDWLVTQGWDDARVAYLVDNGHAPSFIARL